MSTFSRFLIVFDDGNKVEVTTSSRDLLALERDGINLEKVGGVEGSYRLAHAALTRLRRTGHIDFDPPSTLEELMDLADLDVLDSPNLEGQDTITD